MASIGAAAPFEALLDCDVEVVDFDEVDLDADVVGGDEVVGGADVDCWDVDCWDVDCWDVVELCGGVDDDGGELDRSEERCEDRSVDCWVLGACDERRVERVDDDPDFDGAPVDTPDEVGVVEPPGEPESPEPERMIASAMPAMMITMANTAAVIHNPFRRSGTTAA